MNFALRLVLLTILSSAESIEGLSQVNFQPGTYSENQIISEFRGATLLLQIEGTSIAGTGFLINENLGYVLTASHVIEEASPDGLNKIYATSPSFPNKRFKVQVLKSLKDKHVDAALLRLSEPNELSTVRPIDICLSFPSGDSILYSLGYPVVWEQEATSFHHQHVEMTSVAVDGSIEVKQAVFGGNSGGPLLDASGNAIGICRESIGIGAITARYIPMSELRPLFDEIPISDRVRALDSKVRAQSISKEELGAVLIKSSQNPTNLELYSWGKYILANRTSYLNVLSLLRSQILLAFIQRGLPDLVLEFVDIATPGLTGRAHLQIAKSQDAAGQTLLASESASRAVHDFQIAGEEVFVASSQLTLAIIQLKIGDLKAAKGTLPVILSEFDKFSNFEKGEALTLSGQIAAKEGNLPSASSDFSRAISHFLANNSRKRAVSILDMSSDINLQLGNREEAKADQHQILNILKNGETAFAYEPKALYKLAQIQTSLGETAQARESLVALVLAFPNDRYAKEANLILSGDLHF